MRALIAAGADPCGLGARDTLRLESGLPLWGMDIDETTTPLEAGLDFAVSYGGDFIGKDALLEQKETGVSRRLCGFVLEGKGIPRHGHEVVTSGGSTGVVTSGNLSPILETGVGLAYLSPPPDRRARPSRSPSGIAGSRSSRPTTLPPIMSEPSRDRPQMPQGYGVDKATSYVDWVDVEERLTESRHYWLATTRPDGRPTRRPTLGCMARLEVLVRRLPGHGPRPEISQAEPHVHAQPGRREVVTIVEGRSLSPDAVTRGSGGAARR